MGVHIEIVIGIIRAGSEFQEFGDPYEFSATVIFRGAEAYVQGASGKFSKSIFEQLKIMFRQFGVETVYWERKKNNRVKQVAVKIN